MTAKLFLTVPVAVLSFATTACDKPTSGQNTRDYRDGGSGATSGTLEEETSLDSTKDHPDRKKNPQEAPGQP